MKGLVFGRGKLLLGAGLASSLLLAQGCLATRDWVKEQVSDPLSGRISQSEGRIEKAEGQISSIGGRVSGVEGKLGQFEGRLGEVDAKADRALNAIANLRLERKLVIDMKDGANFAFNSSNLPPQAQQEIDSFLSDLKGDSANSDGVVFMVAGHTDNVGPENYNYDLGKKRADAVSRYLITKKNMDPLRVVPVSYGQSAPVENNTSPLRWRLEWVKLADAKMAARLSVELARGELSSEETAAFQGALRGLLRGLATPAVWKQ
jgi:outer membrane protein OmpA-like peptidoglycan-associated protein